MPSLNLIYRNVYLPSAQFHFDPYPRRPPRPTSCGTREADAVVITAGISGFALPQQRAGHHEPLDLVRALVDLRDLGTALVLAGQNCM